VKHPASAKDSARQAVSGKTAFTPKLSEHRMRTLLIGMAALALTIVQAAPAAWADGPERRSSFEPKTDHSGPRCAGLLTRLFPPPRQISNGCTVKWGGGLNDGRFMVRRVTSC
jgi:hypothetical protein